MASAEVARELCVAVEVHCKLYRCNNNDKKLPLGSELVRLVSQHPRDVKARLELALRERMGSARSTILLKCGFLHSFKVSLAHRGGRRGGTAFDTARYRLGVWPQRMKHKPRLVLAADVQVVPCLPKELPLVLPALPGWPPGRYLLAEHRVACGCGPCREAQGYEVDEAAVGNAGAREDDEWDLQDEEDEEETGTAGATAAGASSAAPAGGPGGSSGPHTSPHTSPHTRRYKRRLQLDERGGFWAPHRYVEHAAGVRLGGGRQPAGVPPLCSQDWIRFRVPLPEQGQRGQLPEHGTGHVELTVSELCRELGYSWQHRKRLLPPPPLPPPQHTQQ